MEYKFGTKNNWRRWQWNRVAKRITGKHLPVLYLATAEDYDRPIAMDKGFTNLIAINRDEGICQAIRRRGNPAICGDLSDILIAWPEDEKIGAVIADLCCGFNHHSTHFLSSLQMHRSVPKDEYMVLSINLMRGRDPESNYLRQELSDIWQPAWGPIVKHRGIWLVCESLLMRMMVEQIKNNKPIDRKEVADICERIIEELLRPDTTSYKSKAGIVMDSMVINWPGGLMWWDPEFPYSKWLATLERLSIPTTTTGVWKEPTNARNVFKARRRIAAMRAIRTMTDSRNHDFPAN